MIRFEMKKNINENRKMKGNKKSRVYDKYYNSTHK